MRAESPPGGAEGQMTDQDVYMGVCVFGAMIKYINLNIFTERKQKKNHENIVSLDFISTSHISLVLTLDGSSEHDAHIWSKSCISIF